MKRRVMAIFLVAVVAAGAGSFVAGHAAGSSQTAAPTDVSEWLGEAPGAALSLEQRFLSQAQQLELDLRARQQGLWSQLEDRQSTDDRIVAQVSAVARCRETLIRAVGAHIMELRGALPGPQQRRLMQSCGQCLGQQVRNRLRWRGGAGEVGVENRPRGNGRGGRGGPGMGRGPRYRWGQQAGVAQRGLRLTDAQLALARQLDPSFDADASRLREEVASAQAVLARTFEDPLSTEASVTSAIDTLLGAHAAAEQRVTQHVLLLRPHLSPEQVHALVVLCRGSAG